MMMIMMMTTSLQHCYFSKQTTSQPPNSLTESFPRHSSHQCPIDVPYTSALYVANNIPTLADRREQLSRKFFNSVLHPSSCLHSLLPPPRDPELIARLRAPSKFPRTATRTKKYQPFLSYALSKYQT